jgi:U4/U6.U5 tri-snRNP-associated protein 2
LDEKAIESVDLHGRKFIAGFIGMNNIKINDYANVCLQLLLHIPPIRNILLSGDFTQCPSMLGIII